MNEQPQGSSFSTLAIHAGGQVDARDLAASLDRTARASLDERERAASLVGLEFLGDIDPRIANPVNAVLEERIAALEGGTAALAVASGEAARLILFHTLLQAGEEFVAARNIDDASLDQFAYAFPGFGWQVKWADAERPESFVEALSDRTKAIFIASIASPGGTVTDIAAIANVARRARVPLIVDNTLATPYLVRPLEHGADIILAAADGLLSGQARALAGLIVDGGSFEWLKDERFPALSKPQARYGGTIIAETFGNFAFATACRVLGLRDLGPTLAPSEALAVLQGVETLQLRMQRHCESALAVAQHLARHRSVKWVRYAGLGTDPGHSAARHYCPKGAGAAFAFALAGGGEAAAGLMSRLRLFSRGTEVGRTGSSVWHPASSTGKGDADDLPARPDVVHLSIGLEEATDIIADLDQALSN